MSNTGRLGGFLILVGMVVLALLAGLSSVAFALATVAAVAILVGLVLLHAALITGATVTETSMPGAVRGTGSPGIASTSIRPATLTGPFPMPSAAAAPGADAGRLLADLRDEERA